MGRPTRKTPRTRVTGQGERQNQGKAAESGEGSGYWTGAHTTHRLRFHLVFIPKYRKRVLQGAIATQVKELFEQASEVNDWQIHEINVQPDHVHLLLQVHPRESVATVVQRLKGGSSRVLRAAHPELEEFLWGESFWSEGYFVESVGVTQEAVIRRYINEQGKR
jgi:putative transposase